MNYTLKQLQDRVSSMIAQQGEDAKCAAWIYTKEDISMKDENGEVDYDIEVNDPELVERIFDDVGHIDYIYLVIQECIDEVTEEQLMLQQQEMVWQLPKCPLRVASPTNWCHTNHIPINSHHASSIIRCQQDSSDSGRRNLSILLIQDTCRSTGAR